MEYRDIVVVGASAGGLETLTALVERLPQDFPASLFIVWHLPRHSKGILHQVLDRASPLQATQATDGEEIKPGHIYVAPPDFHMLLEPGQIRVLKGPKENRFRPAIDPLFRSAAYAYKSRVIGVVLTGLLDDGTSGLWTIKLRGGVAVVQDPKDAKFPSMPESALREVEVDHCVPVTKMASLLHQLVQEPVSPSPEVNEGENRKTAIELRIAAGKNALQQGIVDLGELPPLTCPECHGVLVKLQEGSIVRFRCHTGHAFSTATLLEAITESTEDALWNALRAMEESVLILNHMGHHFADMGQSQSADLYLQKAQEAEQRTHLIRQVALQPEPLNPQILPKQPQND